MTRWIGAASLMLTLMLGGAAAFSPASAAPPVAAVHTPQAWRTTDLSARRRARHHQRYVDRLSYGPNYYDRPYYYAPAPFVPFNFGYDFWPGATNYMP
jgi:hypothetical protein